MPEETTPIPEPPGLPFIGNVHEIDSEYPLGSIIHLADQYGEIYRLHLAGRTIVIASTNALVNELCDEKRFVKGVNPVLAQVRNGVHDGLFTAAENEQNWGIAHRVLMPAFGPMSIRGMFDEMYDIGSQLALKWSRHGPDVPIMVTDDFTRLALDTIALCSMNYRFNSYYHDEMHPFIEAMGSFLKECGSRSRRIGFTEVFYRQANQKYWADIEVLRKTADGVLKARKEHPSDRKDLLGAMLEGVDPKTGERMSDASIIDNLITFLIAGHETTSGMLSFAFYQLLKHPEAYRKAQQEVDDVVGTGPIAVEHLPKLHYIQAILRETLRLSATIPQIAVQAREDTLLAGKYPVPKGEFISLLLAKAQTDPVVFGDDANEFVPERMLDENFERLNREFPNCWKPFGNGLRACIGRPFAWQEATMVTAMLLQNFNFLLDDPSYHLTIKQTLTIKPKDFYMRAVLRDGLTPTMLEQRLHRKSSKDSPAPPKNSVGVGANARPGTGGAKGKPMSIYYGSNSGTCESLAQRLASDASAHGFRASVVHSLDAANQKLPQDQPVVIITASYEGQPPDNAAHFVAWLQSLKGAEMENVSYAVFGCGHHDWSQTFHRIPKLVDATIEKLGGSRLVPMGLADAGEGDLFTEFETWEDEIFWPAIAKEYGTADAASVDAVTPGLTVEITTPRSSTLRQDVREAVVIANKDITAEGAPLKKHIEIQLPSDVQYSSGDYLAILPLNQNEIVSRALRKFQIAWDAFVTITAEGHTTLPTNTAISAHDVLSAYVELAQPATKRNVLTLAEAAKDDATKSQLKALATDAYSTEISAKRVSILDLLERFPAVALPFGTFLSLLPPMRVRQYSISSSPLWNPSRVTLTYAVLDAPALSGSTHRHVGVASSYLASLAPGDKLHVAVRPSHVAFHLPVDAEHTPVICVAAGTGLAPFRGFVQERAAMIGAGRSVAPAMLFFGCRDPELDDLYRDELDRWAKMGAVDVRRAYSRKAGVPEAKGCRYVQERLWEDRLDVDELWGRGAKVYVCGSRDVGENVKQVALKMRKTAEREKKGEEMNDEEAVKWFDGIRNERYATDVFD